MLGWKPMDQGLNPGKRARDFEQAWECMIIKSILKMAMLSTCWKCLFLLSWLCKICCVPRASNSNPWKFLFGGTRWDLLKLENRYVQWQTLTEWAKVAILVPNKKQVRFKSPHFFNGRAKQTLLFYPGLGTGTIFPPTWIIREAGFQYWAMTTKRSYIIF